MVNSSMDLHLHEMQQSLSNLGLCYMPFKTHLWLEVNRLQTAALKLHHGFEAFVVLSLKPRGHSVQHHERETKYI